MHLKGESVDLSSQFQAAVHHGGREGIRHLKQLLTVYLQPGESNESHVRVLSSLLPLEHSLGPIHNENGTSHII